MELQSLTNHGLPPERAHVGYDGRFEFRNISDGQYLFDVKTQMGELLYREIVQIQNQEKRLYVKLRGLAPDRPSSGVVSVNELTHKPPKEARKAFNKSVKMLQKGDAEGSLALLQKAVELDPNYMHAVNNLGVRYLLAGRTDEAIIKFKRAIELDAYAPAAHANLAHALVMKGDSAAAEAMARKAVDLNREDAKPAYLLGLSLVMQGKFTPEALANLRRSEHISPRAQLTLGLALVQTGSVNDAKQALTSCLKSNDGPVRIEAQRLLSNLR